MTLDQLRVFVAVAERAHVTRAAEALGLTQSAASAAIASLEARHGVQLFDRVGRRIRLTELGRRLLPEARSVLARARAAEAALAQAAGVTTGRVVLFASQTIACHWLPRRLAAFHDDYPGVALEVSMANTRAVEAAVVEERAQIGLVEGPTAHSSLLRKTVGRDRPVLAHPPGKAPPVGADGRFDLRAMAWIVREEGSGTRGLLETLAAREGLTLDDLRIVLTLPSNEAIREAVEAGAGAAIISEQVVEAAVATGRLTVAPLDLPPRDFILVRRLNRAEAPAEAALVERLVAG